MLEEVTHGTSDDQHPSASCPEKSYGESITTLYQETSDVIIKTCSKTLHVLLYTRGVINFYRN